MLRKVAPKFFDGHKYVLLTELPIEQNILFGKWIQGSSFLPDPATILEQEAELVKYEEYEFWYDQYFLTEKDMDDLI